MADSRLGLIQGELQASCTKNHRKKTGTSLKGLPLAKLGVILASKLWIKRVYSITAYRQKGMVDGKTGRMLANK